MVGGTVAVAICLLILGWAKEIVAHFVEGQKRRNEVTIWVAVVDIYILDFVINIGESLRVSWEHKEGVADLGVIAQATCRALVVDMLPVEKQQLGAAWGKSSLHQSLLVVKF